MKIPLNANLEFDVQLLAIQQAASGGSDCGDGAGSSRKKKTLRPQVQTLSSASWQCDQFRPPSFRGESALCAVNETFRLMATRALSAGSTRSSAKIESVQMRVASARMRTSCRLEEHQLDAFRIEHGGLLQHHDEQLRAYLAHVKAKVPMPYLVTAHRGPSQFLRKRGTVLALHFRCMCEGCTHVVCDAGECCGADSECTGRLKHLPVPHTLLPHRSHVVKICTSGEDWKHWLKLAFCLAKVGLAAMGGSAEGAFASCKALYGKCSERSTDTGRSGSGSGGEASFVRFMGDGVFLETAGRAQLVSLLQEARDSRIDTRSSKRKEKTQESQLRETVQARERLAGSIFHKLRYDATLQDWVDRDIGDGTPPCKHNGTIAVDTSDSEAAPTPINLRDLPGLAKFKQMIARTDVRVLV